MNTNISLTLEAAAVLTDFPHQKVEDHLGSCKESADFSTNGSASMGCLPKRLRTLSSSNRDLSYLYRYIRGRVLKPEMQKHGRNLLMDPIPFFLP